MEKRPLPKIKLPTYTCKLPSNNSIIVTFRPWQGAEEKILLMAKEGNSLTEITEALFQVVNNCIIGFSGKKKQPELSVFDVEYLFIMIRTKSVGNIQEFIYTEDNQEYKLSLDLSKVEIVHNPKHTNKFMLEGDLGIIMKYPDLETVKKIAELDNKLTELNSLEIVQSCVDSVFDTDGIYKLENYTPEEKQEFFESLTLQHYAKIQEFFETAPKLEYKVPYVTKGGVEKVLTINDIQNFF